MNKQAEAQCVVSANDYRVHWEGGKMPAKVYQPPTYDGPERRANAHDRRWLSAGGRRRFDRKVS